MDIGVKLDWSDLSCHLHGWGEPESGKSKMIEKICRELVISGQGFCFFDRHGHTYQDLLEWLAYVQPKQKVYLLDTACEDTMGFPAFRVSDKQGLPGEVEVMVSGTVRACGAKDVNDTPRLAKWLRCVFWAIAECGLPLEAFEWFLDWDAKGKRQEIYNRLTSEKPKRLMRQLYATRQYFLSMIESTENKLEIFSHPQIKRILSRDDIDPATIMDEGSIVLGNFQSSKLCDERANRVIGSIFVSKLVHYALQRPKNARRFYLVLDECHNWLSEDTKVIVDETRKFGLSLLAFHQRLSQLPADIASALSGCKVKVIFSTDGSPKPQRHFECIHRTRGRESGVMPEVRHHPMKPETVQAYKRELLRVDRPEVKPKNEEEWNATDFYRKR